MKNLNWKNQIGVPLLVLFCFVFSGVSAWASGPYLFLLTAGYPQPTVYTWTGKAGDSNFNTPGNWWGGLVPGAAHTAVFDYHYCSTRCDVTLNANVNVQGIRIHAFYPGTITQASGVSITVGVNSWIQAGGWFVGSNSADAITIGSGGAGVMTVTGPSFISTRGNLLIKGNGFTMTPTSFNANSGTVTFGNDAGCCGQFTNITPGSSIFHNVTFNPYWQAANFNLSGGTLNISGNLRVSDPGRNGGGMRLNSGSVLLSGDVIFDGIGYGFNLGSAIISLVGSSPQSITGNGGLTALTLASSSTVTISGSLTLVGNFIRSSGTLNASGSTVAFDLPCGGGYTLNLGGQALHHLGIQGDCNGPALTITGTQSVLGDLNLTSTGNINGGTIALEGNLSGGASWSGGNGTISLVGSGTQTVTGGRLPAMTIASSGVVNFTGTVTMVGHLTYTSGTFNAGTSTLAFRLPCGGGYSLNMGSQTIHHLNVTGNCNNPALTIVGTAKVGGNLDLSLNGNLNGGTIDLSGNLTAAAWNGGTSPIRFVGTSLQTVTGPTSGSLPTGNITVDNASGIALGSNVSWNGSTQSTTVTQGSITMGGSAGSGGSNLTLRSLSLNGNSVTKNAGVLTVGGSVVGTGSLYGGTVNP